MIKVLNSKLLDFYKKQYGEANVIHEQVVIKRRKPARIVPLPENVDRTGGSEQPSSEISKKSTKKVLKKLDN